MALGKTHDKANMFLGTIISAFLLIYDLDILFFICFNLGWMFSTFIFGPDTDIGPKKRTGLLAFVLYPYSILMKHRGHSHSYLFGTFSRILYAVIMTGLILFILAPHLDLSFGVKDYFFALKRLALNFDLDTLSNKAILWAFLGMAGADAGHIFIDRASTRCKKAWRRLFKA